MNSYHGWKRGESGAPSHRHTRQISSSAFIVLHSSQVDSKYAEGIPQGDDYYHFAFDYSKGLCLGVGN